MILGIAEDFSSNVVLDSELLSVPTSGMYLNSGVHPSITLDNLLHFLSNLDITPEAWAIGTTYGIYSDSRKRSDLVIYDSKIYQSIKAGVGQNPATETTYWLETNLESLRLKNLIQNVLDKVYLDLKLTKRIINNANLYEVGKTTITLPNDYAAWIFEPKGSDYTSIRINEVSFQKKSTTPVSLYVINQGILIYNLKTVITEIRFCEHKYINYNHFLVFIRENYPTKIKKRELIIVLDVLPTYFTENLINDGVVSFSLLKSLNSTKWNELLKSNIDLEFKLVIFKSILENSTCMPKEKHEVFISEALVSTIGLHPFPEKLDEIIFSFFESTIININHGNNINLLIKLFSIELNHIPSWINMMNKCLKHWEVYDREIINILLKNYSVISYDLENICTEILVSWEREVMHTKKSSNTQYFVIALSHPNLRSLALSTSIEIYSSPSLQLKNKELKIIVDKIVEQNEYPEWNLDKV